MTTISCMGNPISRELFLERALSRFGDRYDYRGIVYKSYKTPIKIHCRIHPVKLISITPEKHLQTTGGCKFCLREMRIQMLERELFRQSAVHPPLQAIAEHRGTCRGESQGVPQCPGAPNSRRT